MVRGTTPPPEMPYEQVGFANAVDDGGKFLRRQYVLQGEDPEYCNTTDAFSLILARNYLAAKGKPYTSPFNQAGDFAHSIAFGQTKLPPLWGDGSGYRDRNDDLGGYQVLLNFRKHQGDPQQAIPTVSLKDVLNGKLVAQDVQGRIVLIGITDLTDVAADYWNTPFGEMPGVVLQAQMISQMLSATLDGRPLISWWSLQGETVWIVLWSIAGGVVGWWFLRPLPLAIAGATSVAMLYLICNLMLTQRSTWIPLVPPLIAFVASTVTVHYLTERLHKA
jgi:CHASE2 domain-containing sensor protein